MLEDNDYDYHIEYNDLDKHWIAIQNSDGENKTLMRFPSREQAEKYVEDKILYWENYFEK